MKKLLVTGIILALSHFVSAKDNESAEKLLLATKAWSDFAGELGKTKVRLSLHLSENAKTLAGNYCYTKYDQRIQLRGSFVDNRLELDELSEGKLTGHFSGNIIIQDESPHFEGVWTNPAREKEIKFSLVHESSVYTSAESRYLHDKPDIKVEVFMKSIKKAILNGDSDWVAKHISYPINVNLKGKRTEITSAKKLKQHFNEIFHDSYKESIKSASTCNMFSNAQGVMLGGGEIWIQGNSIITINN